MRLGKCLFTHTETRGEAFSRLSARRDILKEPLGTHEAAGSVS
jgi:hypothetical protein